MTDVKRGIRTEVTSQLNETAAQEIAQWIGCFGVVWNCKVAENKSLYQSYLRSTELDADAQRPQPDRRVSHFQTAERPWLRKVPSQVRRNAADEWWKAMQAGFRGLRSFPTFRKASDKKNCYVTNELFETKETETEIRIGLKKRPKSKPFCWLRVEKSHNEVGPPNSLWLRRNGARFWVSWSYSVERELKPAKAILSEVADLQADEQDAAVVGIDMGVSVPVAMSTGDGMGFAAAEARSMRRHEKHTRRLTKASARKRRAALRDRRKCGSNYRKTKQALGDAHARKANLRNNAAHRISKRLAEEPATRVVVAEALNIKGMVRKPKAKKDAETGRWIRNGARAKAGLNRAILNIAWGSILGKLEYKLAERDKLLVQINPKYSSQECEKCGHTRSDNRKSQALFACVECGHTANADTNAARVLKGRFLSQLNAGTFALKAKTAKKIAPRRNTREAERIAVSASIEDARSACGADVRPRPARGCGCEAGSRRGDPRQAEASLGSSVL